MLLYYHFKKNSNYHKLKIMIHDAENYLDDNDYERASLIYKEISMSYERLSNYEKNKIFDEISVLCDLLNNKFLHLKIIEAEKNPAKAKKELEKAKFAFNLLRKEMKKLVKKDIDTAINKMGASS